MYIISLVCGWWPWWEAGANAHSEAEWSISRQWIRVRPLPFCWAINITEYKELFNFDQSLSFSLPLVTCMHEHGVISEPSSTTTAPGFSYYHCLVRQQLLSFLWILRGHDSYIYSGHWTQLNKSGTSCRSGTLLSVSGLDVRECLLSACTCIFILLWSSSAMFT